MVLGKLFISARLAPWGCGLCLVHHCLSSKAHSTKDWRVAASGGAGHLLVCVVSRQGQLSWA